MNLKCQTCDKSFPSNTSLYMHNQRAHTPSLVLLNHRHDEDDEPGNRRRRRRHSPNDGDDIIPGSKRNDFDESLDDVPLSIRKRKPKKEPKLPNIIDEDEVVPGVKRKGFDDDEDDDESLDDVPLSIRKQRPPKEPKLEIIEPYPKPDSEEPGDEKLNYKALYKLCIKENKKLEYNLDKQLKDVKSECQIEIARRLEDAYRQYKEEINRLNSHHDDELLQLKNSAQRRMSDLETLKDEQCSEKLKDLERKCREEISTINAQHEKELSDLEVECRDKVRLLSDQIKALQENDHDLSSLNNAIFNCVTMEEIFKIQRLVKNHQLDEVVQNHLKTLQNLFLSLSHGVLPICQPQRDRVTDSQRRLVDQIQTSSKPTVKRLMKANRNDVVNLFTIIKESLKMARNSYNIYGTRNSDV